MHPVAPNVKIKRVKIPRRTDVVPQIAGLKPDLEGDLKAEWVSHNGFFKKVNF
jgi:hypothetical protein